MARRPWIVRPDHEVDTLVDRGDGVIVNGEPIRAVSPQALVTACSEGAVLLSRCGGVLEVLVNRARTGFGDEMVTTLAQVQWKDRTDARPQSEPEGGPLGEPRLVELDAETQAQVDELNATQVQQIEEEPPEAAAAEAAAATNGGAHPVSVAPDGAEVDESSVPEHLRSA